MSAHDHTVYTPGCYRCELGRDEAMDVNDKMTGTTADGVKVRVSGHRDYRTARVWIDGIERKVFRVQVMRDGGTTRYVVDGGTLTLPNRIGSDDRTPRWRPSPDALERRQQP